MRYFPKDFRFDDGSPDGRDIKFGWLIRWTANSICRPSLLSNIFCGLLRTHVGLILIYSLIFFNSSEKLPRQSSTLSRCNFFHSLTAAKSLKIWQPFKQSLSSWLITLVYKLRSRPVLSRWSVRIWAEIPITLRFIVVFSKSLQANSRTVPRLGNDHFLTNPLHFIM
jgi:hypothetical protein